MPTLPTDSDARKRVPLYSGVFRLFPAALCAVAKLSIVGNEKHVRGTELVHLRGVSGDHDDCILRHTLDAAEGDGCDEKGVPHVVYRAWRALAAAQEWLEEHDGAPIAPGAHFGGNHGSKEADGSGQTQD